MLAKPPLVSKAVTIGYPANGPWSEGYGLAVTTTSESSASTRSFRSSSFRM